MADEPRNGSTMHSSVAVEPVPPAGEDEERSLHAVDIRAAKPYLFSRSPLRQMAVRIGSIVALVVLDVSGLGLSLYGALTLREIYYGHSPILWGLLWDAETDWLP